MTQTLAGSFVEHAENIAQNLVFSRSFSATASFSSAARSSVKCALSKEHYSDVPSDLAGVLVDDLLRYI